MVFFEMFKKPEGKIPRVLNTEKEKPIILLKWAVCDSPQLRLAKEQEVSGLFKKLGFDVIFCF